MIHIRQRYPALDRQLGLDAESHDRLLELLANQLIEMRKASLECRYESTCGTRLPQLQAERQLELANLLGPEAMQRYDDSLESRPGRLAVAAMRGRLTDKNHLADAQAEALIQAPAGERKRFADEFAARGQPVSMTLDGIPFAYSADMTYDGLMEQAQRYQDALRQRAASLLSPQQLAVHDQMAAEKTVVVRATARAMMPNRAAVSH